MDVSCTLVLPDDFRTEPLVRYHLRDPKGVSERWLDGSVHKGLMWRNQVARLSLRFEPGAVHARLAALADPPSSDELQSWIRHLAGLDQPIAEFEARAGAHPQLGVIVQQQTGLRVALTATPFEALVWAITGQQISVAAAVSIRRRLINLAQQRYNADLACHPDAPTLARLPIDALRSSGLSLSKAQTIHTVSRAITEGTLDLELIRPYGDLSGLRGQLLNIRGIGPWTADYTLLRGYGWMDASLHGDIAVRRALGRALTKEKAPTAPEAQSWLAQFSPWRALAAAHLWASNSVQA